MSHLTWIENETEVSAFWQSESSFPIPSKAVLIGDETKADEAYHLACEGVALIWKGDFHNAKQMLKALSSRVDKKTSNKKKSSKQIPIQTQEQTRLDFYKYRQKQSHRSRVLGMLLIPVEADFNIPLRRAPNVKEAFQDAYIERKENFVVSLREALGIIGSFEWKKKGVYIPSLEAQIHPSYGVFSPIRGEYLDLIQKQDIARFDLAFEVGTGTGVIAALLAKMGVKKIIATDINDQAIQCAKENISRLGYDKQVEIIKKDFFPDGRASLIICNPPWIPIKPNNRLELALFDHESNMLKNFLRKAGDHLVMDGEVWLILSDIAEHLGLRQPGELLELFKKSNLEVIEQSTIKPTHQKVFDQEDPLYIARSKEVTSLWRLKSIFKN